MFTLKLVRESSQTICGRKISLSSQGVHATDGGQYPVHDLKYPNGNTYVFTPGESALNVIADRSLSRRELFTLTLLVDLQWGYVMAHPKLTKIFELVDNSTWIVEDSQIIGLLNLFASHKASLVIGGDHSMQLKVHDGDAMEVCKFLGLAT